MEEAVRRGDLNAVTEYIRFGSADSKWKRDISLLLVAIEKGYEDIALALLGAQTLRWEDWVAHGVASDYGIEVLVQKLSVQFLPSVRAGANCVGLTQMQMNDLFRHACRKGDWKAIGTLLKSGCCVSILSKEEQEELLLRAFDGFHAFVSDTFVAQALLQNVDVNILSRKQQESVFLSSCHSGDLIVCDILVASGCNVNCWSRWNYLVDYYDVYTSLMVAADAGHEQIVKKLILAGAKVRSLNPYNNTALHLAAAKNHIQCGVLLAESGASVRTKNKDSLTPLDVAQSAEFVEAIKQATSFTTRKTLCIIGNAGSGKSTLIAALQAERNSLVRSTIILGEWTTVANGQLALK